MSLSEVKERLEALVDERQNLLRQGKETEAKELDLIIHNLSMAVQSLTRDQDRWFTKFQ